MAATTPVIDMWTPIVPAREIMAHVAEHFPEPMLGYLRVFFKQEPSLETFRNAARALARDDAEAKDRAAFRSNGSAILQRG